MTDESPFISVDAACDRFESEWREGNLPELEKFLSFVEPSDRDDLKEKLQALHAELLLGEFPVTRFIGPYKVLQKIGEGGMGSVWLAQQEEPVRRRVALKLVRPEKKSSDAQARFDGERQALAMMNHPNIVKVLDAGNKEGRPYYVMELIQGKSLFDHCDSRRLGIEDRIRLLIQLCSAVEHIHRRGVIHRDLKPDNVLVSSVDGASVLKVIDFGLAKSGEGQIRLTDQTLATEFGQVLGTLRYISPELAEMNPMSVDHRSDIYSLGVMLFEILTGTTPIEKSLIHSKGKVNLLDTIRKFEAPSPSDRIRALTLLAETSSDGSASDAKIGDVCENRRSTPRKMLQYVRSTGLDWVALKALDNDVNRRYQTAGELRGELEKILGGLPISVGPPTIVRKLQVLAKKQVKAISLIAFVALLLVGAVLSTLWISKILNPNVVAEAPFVSVPIQDIPVVDASVEPFETSSMNAFVAPSNDSAHESYVSEIRKTWNEWDEGNVNLAWHVLESCDRDLMGWEAGYVFTEFTRNQNSIAVHNDAINDMALFPDGKRIASAALDDKIVVSNFKTGRTTFEIPFDNPESVDVSSDGAYIAAANYDGHCKAWDAKSLKEVFSSKLGNISCVRFSPDSKMLAVSTARGRVVVWDLATTNELLRADLHEYEAPAVCWSPDGTSIMSCGKDGRVVIQDVESKSILLEFAVHKEGIRDVAWSPDGLSFATASDDHSIKLSRVADGSLIRSIQGCGSGVESVAFFGDGQKIVSGGGGLTDMKDTSVRIWDVESGKELGKCLGHGNTVTSVLVSKGNKIISGSFDTTIKVWDVREALRGAGYPISSKVLNSLGLSKSGDYVVVGGFDNVGKVLSFKTSPYRDFTEIFEIEGHQPRVERSDPNPEHEKLLDHVFPESYLTGISFAKDDSLIISSGTDNNLNAYDLELGKPAFKLGFEPVSEKARAGISGFAVSHDDNFVVAVCCDGKLRKWNLDDRKVQVFDGNTNSHSAIAISPNGKLVAAAGLDGRLSVWDFVSGQLNWTKRQDEGVATISFSCDSTTVYTGDIGGNVRSRDAEESTLIQEFVGQRGNVTAIVEVNDGKRLITAGTDHTVRVWEVTRGRELLKIPIGGKYDSILKMVATPDSKFLITTTLSGQVILIENDFPSGEIFN